MKLDELWSICLVAVHTIWQTSDAGKGYDVVDNVTYQALVLERIENASHEKPEWPQEFKAKFKYEVGDHDQGPKCQEFQVNKCIAASQIAIR
jgi:hypothetical protein